MEATSAYWKPPFYLLEDDIECWVVNARDVKNVPGRPKTDKLDSVWLAKLAERGMLRPSFIPGRPQRQLRDLTRYRRTLTQERTREKQRAEKLLEDAQVKLSSVISDIFGASGRDMLAALIAGQRDPRALADLARKKMRAKIKRPAGGAHRALHRPPRVPAGHDARPRRRAHRSDRYAHHPDRRSELPRVFRTSELVLFHAAGCRFGYSSRTSCGVRYPSPE